MHHPKKGQDLVNFSDGKKAKEQLYIRAVGRENTGSGLPCRIGK